MSLPPSPSPNAPRETLIALRVVVRSDSLAAFSERYWRLVRGDRILLVASRPRAIGAQIRFTLALTDGSDVMRGQGRVVRMRRTLRGASWVELAFAPLDEPSRRLVSVLQALRAAHGEAPHDAGDGLEFDAERPTDRIERHGPLAALAGSDGFGEFDDRVPTHRMMDHGPLFCAPLTSLSPDPLPLPPPPASLLPSPSAADSRFTFDALAPPEELGEDDIEPDFAFEWQRPPTVDIVEDVANLPVATGWRAPPVSFANDDSGEAIEIIPAVDDRRETAPARRRVLLRCLIALLALVAVALGALAIRDGALLPPPVPLDVAPSAP